MRFRDRYIARRMVKEGKTTAGLRAVLEDAARMQVPISKSFLEDELSKLVTQDMQIDGYVFTEDRDSWWVTAPGDPPVPALEGRW